MIQIQELSTIILAPKFKLIVLDFMNHGGLIDEDFVNWNDFGSDGLEK